MKTVGKILTATVRLALPALLLFSLSLAARAQGNDADTQTPQAATPQSKPRHEGGGRSLLARLNLTPEQRAQIRTLREQTEAEGRVLMQRVRQARRALDEAIYSDAADEQTVAARADEVAQAQSALVRLRALTEVRIRRVLTPEQLTILRELRQQALTRQLRREDRTDAERFKRREGMRDQRRRRHHRRQGGETVSPPTDGERQEQRPGAAQTPRP